MTIERLQNAIFRKPLRAEAVEGVDAATQGIMRLIWVACLR